MTSQLSAQAHRLARLRADVASHPWLPPATDYCLAAIDEMGETPHAYEVMFALHFLDSVASYDTKALPLLERLARRVRTDGPTAVEGGADGEVLHLLDFSPQAGTPL